MTAVSADTIQEFLISGLKNAHAMERQAVTLVSAQAQRLEHYPHLEKRLREHLKETEGQQQRIEHCLETLGTSPSLLKDVGLQMSGAMMTLVHTAAPDEVIKNALASFAFENFEVAAYTALIEAARLAGNETVQAVCQENLEQEIAMANWLRDNLPELVRKYVGRSSSGVTAKV